MKSVFIRGEQNAACFEESRQVPITKKSKVLKGKVKGCYDWQLESIHLFVKGPPSIPWESISPFTQHIRFKWKFRDGQVTCVGQ